MTNTALEFTRRAPAGRGGDTYTDDLYMQDLVALAERVEPRSAFSRRGWQQWSLALATALAVVITIVIVRA